MYLSRYFVWFFVFSIMGWLFETVYCTVKEGRWMNRGFLFGPLCPIYGVGATAIAIIYEIFLASGMEDLKNWQLFLIGYFGSIVLEYGTSLALEYLFHAKWWDYSDMPLNVNGRVCVPASILFGLGGLFVIRVLYPWILGLTGRFMPIMIEGISLILMAGIASDASLTIAALTHFDEELMALEENINDHMEAFVAGIGEKKAESQAIIAAERNRLTSEYTERLASLMTGSKRSALARVKVFTPHRSEHHIAQKMRIHAAIKKRMLKIKK